MKRTDLVDEYGQALYELGKENDNVVVIDCDLAKSSGSGLFMKHCPNRYINCGIAEQNAFGISAGLAAVGFIPVVHTFAVFASLRALDQIRNSICYPNLNVKIVGHKAGLSDSYNGATHQSIEDIAIMTAIPNLVVLSPSDAYETKEALRSAIHHKGPVYIRINKLKLPVLNESYRLGKANVLRNGSDLTIITTGDQLINCSLAADELGKEGIQVKLINISTIKPIDEDEIVKSAIETKAILTVESHNVINGLGSQVARVVAHSYPVYVVNIGIQNCFTETGDYEYLLKKYRLDTNEIVVRSRELMNKKRSNYDKERAVAHGG